MGTIAPAAPPLSALLPPVPPGRLAVVTLVVAIVVITGVAVAVTTFDIDGVKEHADHGGVNGGQRHERSLHRKPA